MKIAHLSDPHILELAGVGRSRLLLNKRLTGWVNLKLHRGYAHKRQVVEAMMDDIRAQGVDHVVITGDVTNLALESEFERAREVFARLGMDPAHVSMVPGNHDVYTQGAERSQRFATFFAPHLSCDLGVARTGDHPSGPFPFVRLRGDVAFIGLSSAVAKLPLFSSGRIGSKQLGALASVLRHPEVKRRVPVLLVHHPLVNPKGFTRRFMRGLGEADLLRATLESASGRALVLHGHLHHRAHRVLPSPRGTSLDHIGATSASLLHPEHDRVAGYNVYSVGREGLERAEARVWDTESRTFRDAPIAQADATHAH